MQFKKGVHVNDAQGNRLGSVEQVVIEPNDGQITHLVVHTGHLLGADKVVPLEHVVSTSDDQVVLDLNADQIKALPDLVEVHYVPLNDVETAQYGYGGDLAQPVFWYPLGGPAGFTYPSSYPGEPGVPFKIDTKVNMPEGSVALAEGAKVFGKDGKHVGNVEKIITAGQKDQVTGLLITKGAFNPEKKMVPANWIKDINAEGVQLSVDEGIIDSLREYKE